MLPPKPTADTTATATAETAAPVAATSDGKVVLKKFGPAKDANDVEIPAPTVGALNFVELSKAFYNTLKNEAERLGVKLEDIAAFVADADKTHFPGHKNGRVAYATVCSVSSLFKLNGLLNKVRGAGGGAAMKLKLQEKDAKIDELKAQLAELMKQLGKA